MWFLVSPWPAVRHLADCNPLGTAVPPTAACTPPLGQLCPLGQRWPPHNHLCIRLYPRGLTVTSVAACTPNSHLYPSSGTVVPPGHQWSCHSHPWCRLSLSPAVLGTDCNLRGRLYPNSHVYPSSGTVVCSGTAVASPQLSPGAVCVRVSGCASDCTSTWFLVFPWPPVPPQDSLCPPICGSDGLCVPL